MANDPIHCIEGHWGNCKGPVEYRMSLSGTGTANPRCEYHWEARLNLQEEINSRYPVLPPADFDPLYAGESWDED